jgi:hypothetical protein
MSNASVSSTMVPQSENFHKAVKSAIVTESLTGTVGH